MKKQDETERRLHELFAADRRRDRVEAPGFREVLHRDPGARSPRTSWWRGPSFAALSAAGGLTVAVASVWLYLQQPAALQLPPTAVVKPVSTPDVVATTDAQDGGTTPKAPSKTDGSGIDDATADLLGSLGYVAGAEPDAGPDADASASAPSEHTVLPAPSPLKPPARNDTPRTSGSPQVSGLQVLVVDAAGPLPAATVTISHEVGYVKAASVLTNVDGFAEFPVLRPGKGYAVEVSFPGFTTSRFTDIRLRANENTPLTVQLAEEIVERVQVAAAGDVGGLTRTTRTSKFSDEYVQDLPVPGRFYQNVLTMAPGAQDSDGDGNPNVRASRSRGFATQVGGVGNVDALNGGMMSRVNPNSIEEMEQAQEAYRLALTESGGELNTESYDPIQDNPFRSAADHPLSTFSIDVDTASYSNVRRFLQYGQLPPPDAVRIEEMVNYFRYDYAAPDGEAPFSAGIEIADCPWNARHRLARIGLRGHEITRGELKGSNLVFLIDVSGSMQPPNKLPLLKSALTLLVEQLDSRDQIAIVVYAGSSGLVLPPTPGSAKAEILEALGRLQAGGSTNGGAGLKLAYRIARERFLPGGINRVILATDGDFNVGTTNRGTLVRRIEEGARDGISITTLGFGMGNYKDSTLEMLADRGNGNHAYIDSLREARKVLVEQIGGTLVTIAKDVKIQVEFNPATVGAYRLIGYENRMLAKEDFNDDRKDAGEIGAGHTVTALYEIVPAGTGERLPSVDPLRYSKPDRISEDAASGESLLLKIRYKDPDGTKSRLLEFPVIDDGRTLDGTSADFRFAAAVAQFGMILRDSPHRGSASLDGTRALALGGLGPDEFGYRAEFIDLIDHLARLQD